MYSEVKYVDRIAFGLVRMLCMLTKRKTMDGDLVYAILKYGDRSW